MSGWQKVSREILGKAGIIRRAGDEGYSSSKLAEKCLTRLSLRFVRFVECTCVFWSFIFFLTHHSSTYFLSYMIFPFLLSSFLCFFLPLQRIPCGIVVAKCVTHTKFFLWIYICLHRMSWKSVDSNFTVLCAFRSSCTYFRECFRTYFTTKKKTLLWDNSVTTY